MNLFKCAKMKEEQEFYVTSANIILKNEQAKIIGKFWVPQISI
ncbi:hypothetical protein [Clostridium gasigenes]|nr:hypothetical protein [Clostridium gasigenes]